MAAVQGLDFYGKAYPRPTAILDKDNHVKKGIPSALEELATQQLGACPDDTAV